mmetsp:Transcript_39557/g.51013  ORF Transcript_39557/g.51013 Transcript_39557/m.51013 type:complete len:568 (-) Transcript_39557:60-1763(-)
MSSLLSSSSLSSAQPPPSHSQQSPSKSSEKEVKVRPGGGRLPRQCSDIGVGAGSLFHEPSNNNQQSATPSHAASTNTMVVPPRVSYNYNTDGGLAIAGDNDQSSAGGGGGGGWWVGILGPHSAYICPLTKKPFVDPVISLTDGVTYERAALTKRNLSKLVAERQRSAWSNARADAVQELLDDKYVLTMPQKLSRLVALKTAGFFGKGGSSSAVALFDDAKTKLLTCRSATMSTKQESPDEVREYARLEMKKAQEASKLTSEERDAFLGKHDGTGQGEQSDDEDSEELSEGVKRTYDVNDDGFDPDKVPLVKRVRRPSVVKQDTNAGMIANDSMRLAVLELKKMLIGGPVAEAHARAHREEENSKLKNELAQVQAKRQEKKQKDQARAMHLQLKTMSLHEMIGGSTQGRRLSVAAKQIVSPLVSDVADDEIITSVEVTLDKSDEERVIYRVLIRNKSGSSGSCAHRFNAYRTLYESLQEMGGAAFYFGGHKQFDAVQSAFPLKVKRSKMGMNLTEEQLIERREGIAKWLNLLLIPQESGIEGCNTCLAQPIRAVVWDCLKLDARVTHL